MTNIESMKLLADKQAQIHLRLIEIEKEKTSVLTKGELDKLDALIRLEQPYIMSGTGIKRRLSELGRKCGADNAGLNKKDTDEAGALAAKFEELTKTSDILKRTLNINKGILDARLRATGRVLAVLGDAERTFTYNKEGRLQKQAANV